MSLGVRAVRLRKWLITLLLLAPLSVSAQMDFEDFGEKATWKDLFQFGGTLKTFNIIEQYYDHPLIPRQYEGSSDLSLRIKWLGKWKDWFSFEIHGRGHAYIYSHAQTAPAQFLPASSGTSRFLYDPIDHQAIEQEHLLVSERLAYAFLHFHYNIFDITIGRQPISYGQTFFWNPMDWLTSFDPNEFDREYKPAVDAVKLEFQIGLFSGASVAYASGDDGDWDKSAVTARYYVNIKGWDLELLAGKVREDARGGIGFAGDVWGVASRGEFSYFKPLEAADSDPFVQATFEMDYTWPNNTRLMGELHYNGYGEEEADYEALLLDERILSGEIYNLGRFYVGALASFEITPLLKPEFRILANLTDGSVLWNPILNYSVSDDVDLAAGVIISTGAEPEGLTIETEFGAYPNLAWLQIKYSF